MENRDYTFIKAILEKNVEIAQLSLKAFEQKIRPPEKQPPEEI